MEPRPNHSGEKKHTAKIVEGGEGKIFCVADCSTVASAYGAGAGLRQWRRRRRRRCTVGRKWLRQFHNWSWGSKRQKEKDSRELAPLGAY